LSKKRGLKNRGPCAAAWGPAHSEAYISALNRGNELLTSIRIQFRQHGALELGPLKLSQSAILSSSLAGAAFALSLFN
jgi:hypothetical protein